MIEVKCRACEKKSYINEADWVGNQSEGQVCFHCTGSDAYSLSEYAAIQELASNRRTPNPFDF